jgi:hypothetical protein
MSNPTLSIPTFFEKDTAFPHGGDGLARVECQPGIEELVGCSQPGGEALQANVLEQESLAGLFDEKREFPRIPFRGRAKAVVFPAGDDVGTATIEDSEVVTSDLSRGGVSILHRSKLVPGQQLMLMLNESMQLAEVRWCCRVWEGLFAAGCSFVRESRDCDIDQKLAAIDVVISSEELWWDVKE